MIFRLSAVGSQSLTAKHLSFYHFVDIAKNSIFDDRHGGIFALHQKQQADFFGGGMVHKSRGSTQSKSLGSRQIWSKLGKI